MFFFHIPAADSAMQQTGVDLSKAYEHPIITDILSSILRNGGQKSPMQRFAEKFKVTWQGEERNELAKAMLALTATVVSIDLYLLRRRALSLLSSHRFTPPCKTTKITTTATTTTTSSRQTRSRLFTLHISP